MILSRTGWLECIRSRRFLRSNSRWGDSRKRTRSAGFSRKSTDSSKRPGTPAHSTLWVLCEYSVITMFSRESPFPMPVSKSTSRSIYGTKRTNAKSRSQPESSCTQVSRTTYDTMMFVTNSEIAPNGKEEPVIMSLGTQVQSVTSCSYFSPWEISSLWAS